MLGEGETLDQALHDCSGRARDALRQASVPVVTGGPQTGTPWRDMALALRSLAGFDGGLVLLLAAGQQAVLHAEGETTDIEAWPPGGGWVVRAAPDPTAPSPVAPPPAGTAHLLEVALHGTAGTLLSIRIFRDAGRPFLEHEAEAVGRIAPLLAGLASCAERLRAAEAAARRERRLSEAMLGVLDQMEVGFCLVDEDMRAAFISGRALRTGAFALRGGRLGLVRADDERRLRAAVAATLASPDAPAQGLCFGAEEKPMRALVTALGGPATRRLPGRLAAVVVPPPSAPEHNDRVIQAMFRLTPVEAVITKLLSDGATPNEAAERMRMKPNTLRGYMKSIFVKLDVHRQSELVRLVSRTAGMVRAAAAAGQEPPRPAPEAL